MMSTGTTESAARAIWLYTASMPGVRPMSSPDGTSTAGVRATELSPDLVERPLNGLLDLADVERLADVVERPRSDGFNGGFQRAESAHQQDLTVRVRTLERPQHIEPVQRAIEVDVADH